MEPGSAGRVIIFTNLRESVNEIVDSLKAHEPLITARCAATLACDDSLLESLER